MYNTTLFYKRYHERPVFGVCDQEYTHPVQVHRLPLSKRGNNEGADPDCAYLEAGVCELQNGLYLCCSQSTRAIIEP